MALPNGTRLAGLPLTAHSYRRAFWNAKNMTQDWSRLFSASGFRWQMGLRTGDVHSFFAPTANHQAILAERGQLLDASPADYAILIDAALPLFEEMRAFAVASGALDSATD